MRGWVLLAIARGEVADDALIFIFEELDADGMLDTATNRGAESTDTYTSDGSPAGYEPRFTYHGFRYLELTGYPGMPDLDSVTGLVAHADVASPSAALSVLRPTPCARSPSVTALLRRFETIYSNRSASIRYR